MVILILVLFGLALGSFVNALVWRLHKQEEISQKPKAKSQKYSIINGRSMCPSCEHELTAKDLVPILSWLYLKGRCRYCNKKFADTPFAEILTPLLFVVSYIYWPLRLVSNIDYLALGLWLVMLVGFVALIIYDIRWYLLPNRIVFPLQFVALVFAILTLNSTNHGLLQVLMSVAFSAGLFWSIYIVSKGKWIGFGDVKLAVVLGLVLGRADLALLMLFISSLLGSLVAIPLLVSKKLTRQSKLPFGPFLIIATIVSLLFGQRLLNWYLDIVLFV